MTNKLQFEGASEYEYTLVGKMNRLQWMNWCVRPEVRHVQPRIIMIPLN